MTLTKDNVSPPGMGIRVDEDGKRRVIPIADFKVGDVVLDEVTGGKFKIITRRTTLSRIPPGATACIKGKWYRLWYHGQDPIFTPLDQKAGPFSPLPQGAGEGSIFPKRYDIFEVVDRETVY